MNSGALSNDMRHRISTHRGAVVAPSGGGAAAKAGHTDAVNGTGFGELFEKKVKQVAFSAHAATRIKSRNISMTAEVLNKLNSAVEQAAEKGARDSLILLNNNAFIVNIPNRTVVTAMDSGSIKENVFTNIDSAVLVD